MELNSNVRCFFSKKFLFGGMVKIGVSWSTTPMWFSRRNLFTPNGWRWLNPWKMGHVFTRRIARWPFFSVLVSYWKVTLLDSLQSPAQTCNLSWWFSNLPRLVGPMLVSWPWRLGPQKLKKVCWHESRPGPKRKGSSSNHPFSGAMLNFGGGFKYFLFSPLFGEGFQFD